MSLCSLGFLGILRALDLAAFWATAAAFQQMDVSNECQSKMD